MCRKAVITLFLLGVTILYGAAVASGFKPIPTRDSEEYVINIEIVYHEGTESDETEAMLIKNQLKQFGINVTLHPMSWNEIFEKCFGINITTWMPIPGFEPEYDLFLLTWFIFPPWKDAVYGLLHSSQFTPNGSNVMWYSNDEIDRLGELLMYEDNISEIRELIKMFNNIFIKELPFIPLFEKPDVIVYNNTKLSLYGERFYEPSVVFRGIQSSETTLNIGIIYDPVQFEATLLPLPRETGKLIQSSLFYYNNTWKGDLATSLTISTNESGVVNYTVHLRDDFTWVDKNGNVRANVTADDILFSWATYAYFLSLNISSTNTFSESLLRVIKLDNYTVVFERNGSVYPYPFLAGEIIPRYAFEFVDSSPLPDGTAIEFYKWEDNFLAINASIGGCKNYTGYISSEEDVAKYGTSLTDDTWFSGPYYVSSCSHFDMKIKLQKNLHYPGTVDVETIYIQDYNSSALFTAFSNGTVDIAVYPDHPEILLQNPNASAVFENNILETLTINCNKYPLSDPDFRRAIGYALNRTEIMLAATHGLGRVINTMIPSASDLYMDIPDLDYNYTVARELFSKFFTPARPSSITATYDGSVVTLSWSAVDNVTRYRVYRATNPDLSDATLLEEVKGTTFEDKTATNGTTYYYMVSAVRSMYESERSVLQYTPTVVKPPSTNENVPEDLFTEGIIITGVIAAVTGTVVGVGVYLYMKRKRVP